MAGHHDASFNLTSTIYWPKIIYHSLQRHLYSKNLLFYKHQNKLVKLLVSNLNSYLHNCEVGGGNDFLKNIYTKKNSPTKYKQIYI